jgi:hypothetical protein
VLIEISPQTSAEPDRRFILLAGHEDLRRRKVMESSTMIRVEMSQNHPAHVFGREPELPHLRADLIIGSNERPQPPSEVRMPPGEVARLGRAGSVASVNDDQPLRGEVLVVVMQS